MKSSLSQLSLALCLTLSASAGVLTGPRVNPSNGHVYYLLTAQTWAAAEAEAQTLGGHLATVRNAEEHNWIFSTFSTFGSVNRTLMIGLNDASVEGTFAWPTGETTAYRNWERGEPNNYQPTYNQDYTIMLPPGSATPGLWRDVSLSESATFHGVVEVLPAGETITPTAVPAVELSWPTQPNKQYQLQASTDPGVASSWRNVGEQFKGTGQPYSFLDSARNNERKFYRVVIITP